MVLTHRPPYVGCPLRLELPEQRADQKQLNETIDRDIAPVSKESCKDTQKKQILLPLSCLPRRHRREEGTKKVELAK